MRATDVDYYSVLGVDIGASSSEIKQRYRALSKRFHPDANGGDVKRMALINEAYAVLSDPIKRFNYRPPVTKNVVETPITNPSVIFEPQAGVRAAPPAHSFGWERFLFFAIAAPAVGVFIAVAIPALAQIIPQQGIFAAKPQSTTDGIISHPIPTADTSEQNQTAVASNQNTTSTNSSTPPTKSTKQSTANKKNDLNTDNQQLYYYSQTLRNSFFGGFRHFKSRD